jgi:hypothetical protein
VLELSSRGLLSKPITGYSKLIPKFIPMQFGEGMGKKYITHLILGVGRVISSINWVIPVLYSRYPFSVGAHTCDM